MIFYKVHYAVQTSVHCAAVKLRVTKILPPGALLIFRDVHGMADKLVYAFVFRCCDWNYGYPEHGFHFVYANGAAVAVNLVHHVERENHGNIQLHQL